MMRIRADRQIEQLKTNLNKYQPYLRALKSLFLKMDQTYEKAAVHYAFKCQGCLDNCCYSLFYHHTFLEYLYLFHGFSSLDPKNRQGIKKRAENACKLETEPANDPNKSTRLMCPANHDTRCLLYKYRPMICRLHGIPHELTRPDGKIIHGPGCDMFSKVSGETNYIKFDRSPFYIEMSQLEKKFRQESGIIGKIKKTVSQMIQTF